MKKYSCPSALTIAGFDNSGGAGIQADIKTFSALGCFATSVLTALPIQNTQGVRKIYFIPENSVAEQIETIMDDIFPQAIKIGMVHTPQLVETIVNTLGKYPKIPIVYDPVMISTSGYQLIENGTIDAIINKLFPIADIITPNMDEASILAQKKVRTLEDMRIAGELIFKLGCKSILLKGGHLESNTITSLFFDKTGKIYSFKTEKFETNNTHGSGCTLSSAISAYLAQKYSLYDSVSLGQQYVSEAIKSGKDFKIGHGNGPLNHFFNPISLIKYDLKLNGQEKGV